MGRGVWVDRGGLRISGRYSPVASPKGCRLVSPGQSEAPPRVAVPDAVGSPVWAAQRGLRVLRASVVICVCMPRFLLEGRMRGHPYHFKLTEVDGVGKGARLHRRLRVEYAGAIYHVMSRGDRKEDISLDDVDRQDFPKTLAECCSKIGFQVHAYCLMRYHFQPDCRDAKRQPGGWNALAAQQLYDPAQPSGQASRTRV